MKGGNREAIDLALLALLNNASVPAPYTIAAPGERHPYNVQETPPANQPTFYLCKIAEGEEQNQVPGLTRYTIHYRVIFYFKIDPTDPIAPATGANQILDAVEAALVTKPPFEKQRLGGLVDNTFIEGTVWIVGGINDQQMELEIPIKAVVGN